MTDSVCTGPSAPEFDQTGALRQNSKSEIRNPKSQTPEAVSRCIAFLVFELRICFGFRASDFEFGRKAPEMASLDRRDRRGRFKQVLVSEQLLDNAAPRGRKRPAIRAPAPRP